jgi:hypothetical protein
MSQAVAVAVAPETRPPTAALITSCMGRKSRMGRMNSSASGVKVAGRPFSRWWLLLSSEWPDWRIQ